MPDAAVLAPLLLAAVLAASGAAKWADRASTSSVVQLLRLPTALHGAWVATALPVGEGLLAAALVLTPAGPLQVVAAAIALALMVTYWVLVARALRFRPRPACGCFGRIGDQTIAPKTLVRNTLLVAVAAVGLAYALTGHSPISTLGEGAAVWAWVLGAVVCATLAGFVVHRSAPAEHAHHHTPVAAQPVAEPDPQDYVRTVIPPAVLTDPDGRQHSLEELASERPQLLVFANCHCGTTLRTIDRVPEWQTRLPRVDLRVVFSGVPVPATTPERDTTGAWTDHRSTAWRTLGLATSPSAVLLGADGQLAGGPVGGVEEVAEFVDDIVDALAELPPAVPAEQG